MAIDLSGWPFQQAVSLCKHSARRRPFVTLTHDLYSLLSIKHSIPDLPYIGIILLEPSLIDAETWYSKNQPMFRAMFKFMKKGAFARRDSWASKAEAAEYLKKVIPYSLWDERIFDLYIVRLPRFPFSCHTPRDEFTLFDRQKHALCETTDKEGKPHVQRKCPPNQSEGGWYNNMEGFWQAIEQSDRVQRIIPVHLVLGTANNKGGDVMYVPHILLTFLAYINPCHSSRLPAIRDMLLDKTKGRTYASVSTIPDVGHQVGLHF